MVYRINVNTVFIINVVYHLHRHIFMRPDNVQVITTKKGNFSNEKVINSYG